MWLAVVAATSSGLLYAEGVLKSGWFEAALAILLAWYVGARRPPASLLPLFLGLASVSVTLVCADMVLRPFMGSRLSFTAFNEYSHNHPSLPIVGRWDADLHLTERSYGDLAAMSGDETLRQPRDIDIHIDHWGFRNISVPESIEVLILGDSFSAGMGTSQEQIFSSLLQHHGYRVYNLSYPGGPYDQFVNLAVESPRLRFDKTVKLIWTLYVGNDLDDAGGEIWDRGAFPWQSPAQQWQVRYRTYRNRSPLNRLSANLLSRRRQGATDSVSVRQVGDGNSILFYDSQDRWSRRSKGEILAHPNFAKLGRTLSSMRELAYELKLPVTVLILPTKGDVYRWIVEGRPPLREDLTATGFAEAVCRACDDAGFHCIDMKSTFVEEAVRLYTASGEWLWWRDDTHLGERGHRLVAQFILDHVLNEGSTFQGDRRDHQYQQVDGSRALNR